MGHPIRVWDSPIRVCMELPHTRMHGTAPIYAYACMELWNSLVHSSIRVLDCPMCSYKLRCL